MKRISRRVLIGALLAGAAGAAYAGWADYLKGLGSRKPARSTSNTVAAVRGWNKDAAASDNDRRNWAAVEKLEAISVSSGELAEFIKEGKLAP